MGIDIYMRWKGQSEAERESQFCGFANKGHLGYLREAYHGGPYATHSFVREAFEDPNGEAKIRACVLKERLEAAEREIIERQTRLYPSSNPRTVVESFRNFADLAELKERETGEPVTVQARY